MARAPSGATSSGWCSPTWQNSSPRGIAIGAVLATVLARALATSLFGVGSADPLTWVPVPLVPAAVALVAALVPARRASRADPLDGLRQTL
jgi:ABC-type antimicrobial peptide transport system permease subunit